MKAVLLVVVLASVCWGATPQSEQVAIVPHEELPIFLATQTTWPLTTRIPWLTGHNVPAPAEQSYDLQVLDRVPAGHGDSFSHHDLLTDGFQWVYDNDGGDIARELVAAFQRRADQEAVKPSGPFKLPTFETGETLEAAVKFWDDTFKARVTKNLKTIYPTLTVADVHLSHDFNRDPLVKGWWAQADAHVQGEPVREHTGIVPRHADINAVANLHFDENINSDRLNYVTKLANNAGYEDYNVWLALSDVKKSPLVIFPGAKIINDRIDLGNKKLLMSEMKKNDYIIFSTHGIAHAGSNAIDLSNEEVDWTAAACDWLTSVCLAFGDVFAKNEDEVKQELKSFPHLRMSVDYRIYVKKSAH